MLSRYSVVIRVGNFCYVSVSWYYDANLVMQDSDFKGERCLFD